MRYLVSTLIPKTDGVTWATIKPHLFAFVCVVVALMAFFAAASFIPSGWLTYALNALAVAILGVTALARVNDIPHTEVSPRWQFRRAGLIAVGTASFTTIVYPWLTDSQIWFPPWRSVLLHWGVAITWMTTPMMPPWHHYISGEFKKLRVEVPNNVSVDVVRTNVSPESGGSMFVDTSKPPRHEENAD